MLSNALLVDLDPPNAEVGALRIEDGRIAARAAALQPHAGDEVLDCAGAVVLPGLVNGHTHLYSALAAGMPPPPHPPRDFAEILELVWWRLDQALDAPAIETSARIGALDALHCGTTTLIDHHASPRAIEGALDHVESTLGEVGVRGILCYETTDRHGRAGRLAGLEENRRYARKCQERRGGRFAALIGAHASFTLEDETLEQLASLAGEFDSGVHIHVAEDPCDEDDCQQRQQVYLIDRLAGHGLLRPGAVFAHCTHLDPEAVERVSAAGLTVAHNPRSNMNNGVGYAPVEEFDCPVMLGTDGIGADMFAEARSAWLMSRHEQAGLTPGDVVAMLSAGARRASAALDLTIGKLVSGAAADVVITDYVPATPIHSGNVAGQVLFALGARHVRHVLIEGRWRLRERQATSIDEAAARTAASAVAADLWQKMERL